MSDARAVTVPPGSAAAAPARLAARSGYMPQIDGVRGLAIIAVIVWHFEPWSSQFVEWGQIGVKLFFVLGAFLVTASLLRARDQITVGRQGISGTLRAFLTGRAIRIVPVLWLTLLVGLIVGLPSVSEPLIWHALIATNLYIGIHHTVPLETAHLWFLGALEQFYLFWLLLILSPGRRALGSVIVALILGGLLFRAAVLLFDLSMYWYFAGPFWNLDALGLGALLGYLRHDPADRWLARASTKGSGWFALALFLIGSVGAHPIYAFSPYLADLSDFGLALALAWLVAGAARGFGGVGRAILDSRPLQDTGVVSYGLYIIHPFMPPAVLALGIKGYPGVILATVLAVVLASLSWHFIEKPIVALKAKRAR
jgi:peptidoglycan/LPS O-acetylase OafA/YrhL